MNDYETFTVIMLFAQQIILFFCILFKCVKIISSAILCASNYKSLIVLYGGRIKMFK